MSPPSDREFDQVMADLRALRTDMAEIKEQLAEQRGWFAAARWLGAGSLTGVVGLGAYVWQALKGQG